MFSVYRRALSSVGRCAALHTSCSYQGTKKLHVDHDVIITRQQAKDLIYRLHKDERRILLDELELYNSIHIAESASTVPKPTVIQLRAIAIHNALPFVGFGFLDNFIMICAGDYIDLTLGLTFGISTMAAAGLGNAISDVAGIGSAWYVERIACKVGVQVPNLSPAQLDMTSTRVTSNLGRALGVLIGCILGMCPLLFLDTSKEKGEEREKKKQEALEKEKEKKS